MNELTGTVALARLALRRDRVQLPVWVIALTLLHVAVATSTLGLYPTEADRAEFAASSARSAVVLAFNGIVTGTSPGEVVASQGLLTLAVGAALMSTLAVVRHTRQNEETGRAELVSSGVVGRHALLGSALLVVVAADLVLGLLQVTVLVAVGLPLGGSLVAGAAIAAVGIAFAAVAAVAAQVPESARAANGSAAAALGAAFLLRAAGDVTGTVTQDGTDVHSGWLSWLSPIGWGQQVRPYDDDAWWVLVVPLAWTVALVALAVRLAAHRDLGAGLRAARPGPSVASPALLRPAGLASRLQRGVLIGWSVGVAVVALSYGAIGNQIDDLIGSSDQVSDLISELGGGSGTLTDAYFASVLGFMGLAVAAYGVQALLRLRAEETGPLETVLATALSRRRWLAGHLVVVVGGMAWLVLLTGLCTGAAYGLVTGSWSDVGGIMTGALVQLPAALVVAGLTVLAFGLLPRWSVAAAWSVLGACLVLTLVGRLLGLPQAVLDLSPFSHVPTAPAVPVTALPLVALLAVAVVAVGAGATAFRRRDIAV